MQSEDFLKEYKIFGVDANDERWSQPILRGRIETKIIRHGHETNITTYSILDKSGILFVFHPEETSLKESVVVKGSHIRKFMYGHGLEITREYEKPFIFCPVFSYHRFVVVLDNYINSFVEVGGIYEKDEKCMIVVEFGSTVGRVGVQYQPGVSQPIKERNILTRPNYHGATFSNMVYLIVGNEIFSEFVQNYVHAERVELKDICQEKRFNSRFLYNLILTKLKKMAEDHHMLFIRPIKVENEDSFGYNLISQFYEDFEVQKLFVVNRAQVAMYRTGRKTGCVVHVGSRKSYVVVIIDGEIMSIESEGKICGNEITRLFFTRISPDKIADLSHDHDVMRKKDYYEWVQAEKVKEELCYIRGKNTDEKEKEEKKFVILRNGKKMFFGEERFMYPEMVLFPKDKSLELKVIQAIESVENIDMQKEIAQNIVMSGGTTCIKGFVERFEEELLELKTEIRIISSVDRSDSSWIGGSLFASMCMNNPELVEKCFVDFDVFEEHGPEYEGFEQQGKLMFQHFHHKCVVDVIQGNHENVDRSERLIFLKKELEELEGQFKIIFTENDNIIVTLKLFLLD